MNANDVKNMLTVELRNRARWIAEELDRREGPKANPQPGDLADGPVATWEVRRRTGDSLLLGLPGVDMPLGSCVSLPLVSWRDDLTDHSRPKNALKPETPEEIARSPRVGDEADHITPSGILRPRKVVSKDNNMVWVDTGVGDRVPMTLANWRAFYTNHRRGDPRHA